MKMFFVFLMALVSFSFSFANLPEAVLEGGVLDNEIQQKLNIVKSFEDNTAGGWSQISPFNAVIDNAAPTQMAYGNCNAYTACPRGGYISCYTYGAGCTWWVRPYREVYCEGYGPYGEWTFFHFYCR